MMKMDLRMKATVLVALLTFLSADRASMRVLDNMFGSVVPMRDAQGALTREGKAVHSLVFALVTYMVMSAGRR